MAKRTKRQLSSLMEIFIIYNSSNDTELSYLKLRFMFNE